MTSARLWKGSGPPSGSLKMGKQCTISTVYCEDGVLLTSTQDVVYL